ncbi:MAG: hypothetical protein JNM93_11020 [Bacteriovoracaceae bacterium]|nr:hypothetical protein [Bacteriovoracaceae bacterium]
MKKLIATISLIVVVMGLGGCASNELTVPKPDASNGKSQSSTESGRRQTMIERHAQNRQQYIGRN